MLRMSATRRALLAYTRVESVGLAERARRLSTCLEEADEKNAEIGFSSNSCTVSTVARRLG